MKILIIRFSSIGDIVLTSPVVRAMREQLDDVEIHYLTKQPFASILTSNPAINKVISIEKSIDEVLDELKNENYDQLIDLHNNIRTKSLKAKLKKPMYSFPKLNWEKWLLVRFKMNKMPDLHVVDRYFKAVEHLNITNAKYPIEFYIEEENFIDVKAELNFDPKEYNSIAIGAQFKTKCMPLKLLAEIIDSSNKPVVLIGSSDDKGFANQIITSTNNKVVDATGKFNLQQSASIVKQGAKLLTNDTGMMHIASTFDTEIVSVWGNTTPALGMYPYRPKQKETYHIHEVEGLPCRPCSKIGYQECPKKHFRCMMDQDVDAIVKNLN